MYAAALLISLTSFWLLMSGIYKPLILVLGGISIVLVMLVASRMRVVDRECLPVHLLPRAIIFWPWLFWQIIVSALNVSRLIVSPSLPITPVLRSVPTSQTTAVGVVSYANAITLTPGTIAVEVERDGILVHALEASGHQDLLEGTMDRQVTRFESAVA